MKKTVSVALALVFLLGILVSGALADTYDYPDNTKVQEWRQGSPYSGGAWKDVIGDAAIFDTFGANLNGNILTIFTNWDPVTMDPDIHTVKTADLFINVGCDDTWDYAIVLDNQRDDFQKVYKAPFTTFQTADDIFKTQTSLIYGGKYDQAAPKDTPALATSDDTGSATVTWDTSGDINTVSIDLSSLGLTEPWGFYWGTATCSNDGFSDCVPIPPSALLMGSGLLGLGLVGWRRRGSEG